MYQKGKPRGSVTFRPGSNPNQKVQPMGRATRKNTTAARPSRPSIVQKLCAQILAAGAAHLAAINRSSDAETAARRAYPKPPKSIQPSKAVRADLPNYKDHHHRAIPSIFIRSELTSLKDNRALYEKAQGVVTIRASTKGFPLNDAQKARVNRLERLLVDVQKYERVCVKVDARFKLKQLDKAITSAVWRQQKLIHKLERVRSASAQDVIAKIIVYRTDPELFGEATFTQVMIEDARRELAKAS
jgi:hypothetical protein